MKSVRSSKEIGTVEQAEKDEAGEVPILFLFRRPPAAEASPLTLRVTCVLHPPNRARNPSSKSRMPLSTSGGARTVRVVAA